MGHPFAHWFHFTREGIPGQSREGRGGARPEESKDVQQRKDAAGQAGKDSKRRSECSGSAGAHGPADQDLFLEAPGRQPASPIVAARRIDVAIVVEVQAVRALAIRRD